MLFFGLGISIANPIFLVYIVLNGSGPRLFGIEFLHGNTLIWNLWGFNAGLVLGAVHAVVSVLGALAGLWLWRSQKKGGKLGIAIQPLNVFFAVGFAVPILYVLAPLLTVLLVLGWSSLH